MIVRSLETRLQLITQSDHAHLAARIMEHCAALAISPRRGAIIRAIAEHDVGWEAEDAAPTVNPQTGEVFDFVSLPVGARQAVWPRAVALLSNDPWAAALVAQHALTVYDRFRSDAAWTSHFSDLAKSRDIILATSGRTLDDLAADYAFVRLGDLISLKFCTGSTEAQGFAGWTVHFSGQRVVVAPDPFDGVVIPFEIKAREIPNQVFRSDAQLHDALSVARILTLRGETAGAPAHAS